MRRIKTVTVTYSDGTVDHWHGNGMVMVADTVLPGPPPTSTSFVTATLEVPARMKLSAAGHFTGCVEPSELKATQL